MERSSRPRLSESPRFHWCKLILLGKQWRGGIKNQISIALEKRSASGIGARQGPGRAALLQATHHIEEYPHATASMRCRDFSFGASLQISGDRSLPYAHRRDSPSSPASAPAKRRSSCDILIWRRAPVFPAGDECRRDCGPRSGG